MNKKGISPLISTVILLVFATGLGLVVMNWSKAIEVEELPTCNAELAIVYIDGVPQLCKEENTVKVMLENNGLEVITGVKISIIDEIGVINDEVNETIGIAEIRQLDIDSSRPVSFIRKIKITPKSQIYCPNKAVEIESIRDCE